MPAKKKVEDTEKETKEETKKAKEETKKDVEAKAETKKAKSAKEEKPKKETKKKAETEKKDEKTEEKTEKEDKKIDLEKLKKELAEKAKELAGKIEGEEDLKEKVRAEKKAKRAEKTIFPLDDYVKYSAHLGTKAVTPNMRQFVYKRRADGLAVLNTNSIDEKLKEAIEFLKDFAPEDIFLACKREAGWTAAKKFSEVTGIRVFTKKYPAGILTNTQLDDFFEAELIIICDPWLDKNALNDAVIVKKPVLGLCDTNNLTTGVAKIVPCNNKSAKSLGLMLYLIAREYLKVKGQKKEAEALNLDDFAGEVIEKKRVDKGARKGV